MTVTSIGDLAASMSSRMQMSRLKSEITTLSTEVSTGKVENIAEKERGDLSRVSFLTRSLEITARYQDANADAALRLSAAQSAMQNVQSVTGDARQDLLIASTAQSESSLSIAGQSAEQALETVIASLNTRVADASLFSGADVKARPLGRAEDLLSTLVAEASAASTLEDAQTAIGAWFDDPAGFAGTFYLGSSEPIAFPVSGTTQLTFDVTASDPVFRQLIEDLAMAALIGSQTLPGSVEERSAAFGGLGESLLNRETELVGVAGEIGLLEERTEEAAVELASAKSAFELGLSDIEAADPYETAARLDAATTQLETLFAVTARLSDLTLTRYL